MCKWTFSNLGSLASGIRGVSYTPDQLRKFRTADTVVLLRANNIKDGSINFDDVQLVPASIVNDSQLLRDGDVAVCMSSGSQALVGKAAKFKYRPGKYTVGAFCSIFRPTADVDKGFVSFVFQSRGYRKHLDITLAGSAINNLRNRDLEAYRLKIPPRIEQSRIAQILDTQDTQIRRTEALIAKLEQIKQGLLTDLLTRGIDENGQLRPPTDQAPHLYKDSPLGRIPREWEASPIEELLERIIDYRGKTPTKTDHGIPLITAKNVRMGYINPEPREFIAESNYESWMRRGIPANTDVVFTTEAPLGNVAQVGTDQRVAFAQRVIILQPKSCLSPVILKLLLMTESFQELTVRSASGSTALGIKQSVFRKLLIAYPVLAAEQHAISKRLEVLDESHASEARKLAKLKELKEGLLDDLLTGRVRVTSLLKSPEPVAG